ncbi:hypothetical protein CXP39_03315 [Mesoplasma syrphidae]|uniref:Lipoprotein n=1 Tax=Mesoplasma syrphidae TaxID=225999 RepID=A0A2K9BVQ6_9MOLU|nr:lipoprotein [Mesoplasma syrphidae]AUF83800.1 hypothetical protein CXP39_03315 [Mesoplasma syrphidae]
MKKLLAIFGAITLTATASTTVVSCGVQLDPQQGNWTPSDTRYGWDYNAELTFADLVSYLRYTAKLGVDIKPSDPNNEAIGIQRNLIAEAKLNNIMTLFKLLSYNLDAMIETLKPKEGQPVLINNRAVLSLDLSADDNNKKLMENLFLGIDNKSNFANKLNQAFSETLGSEQHPWTPWKTFNDFNQEPGMYLILQANGILDRNNELVSEGISSSLSKIRELRIYLIEPETLNQTTEQIANGIWDIFRGFDKFVNLGWTINKKVKVETEKQTEEEKFEYPGLMVSFNIGIQSWRR